MSEQDEIPSIGVSYIRAESDATLSLESAAEIDARNLRVNHLGENIFEYSSDSELEN